MLRESIISTLAHYQAERGLPLSAFEVFRFLHKSDNIDTSVKFVEVLDTLCLLKREGVVFSKNGFFFLEDKIKTAYANRIKRDKISQKKWKKAHRLLKMVSFVPFVRSVAVSGSISMNNAFKDSDIDLFLIVKRGRIWTARIISMLITHILRARRYKNNINNRVCLNYFICEEASIQVKNIASANIFLRMVPVFGRGVFYNFYSQNRDWVSKFFVFSYHSTFQKREVCLNCFFKSIKKNLEALLSFSFGNTIEIVLSFWQKKRIRNKIKGKNISHLIFNDDILMFHWPKPRNDEVVFEYKRILNKNKLSNSIIKSCV